MPLLFNRFRVMPVVDHGAGGMQFHTQAHQPGFALVGLRLRAGDWIDQVTPIFAELLEDGTFGMEHVGPSYGGHGGWPRELRVAPGHVVTGLQTRSGHYLDGIRLFETPWNGSLMHGESRWTPWITGNLHGGVERPEQHAEPKGRAIAVGIAGRAGGYVDGLELVTAELHLVRAAELTAASKSRVAAG